MKTINHVSGQNNAGRTLLSPRVSECEPGSLECYSFSLALLHILQSGSANEMFVVHFIRFILCMWEIRCFV